MKRTQRGVPRPRPHSKAEAGARMRVWALGLKIRFLELPTQECWAEVKLEKEMLVPNPQTRQVPGTSQVPPGLTDEGCPPQAEGKASLRIPV